MSIAVTCGECTQSYRLADRYAGKRCKCKECGARIRVPKNEVGERTEKRAKRKKRKARKRETVTVTGSRSRKDDGELVTASDPTRRLAAQGEGDIMEDRRELRARVAANRPVSESLHQLVPLHSGDRLDRFAPTKRRKKKAKQKQDKAKKARARKKRKDEAQAKGKGTEAKKKAKKGKGTEPKLKAKKKGKGTESKLKAKQGKGTEPKLKAKGKRTTGKRAVVRRRETGTYRRTRGRREAEGALAGEPPTKKAVMAVVAILGTLCLAVGLAVGFFINGGGVVNDEVTAQLESIETAKRARDWSGAQTQIAALEATLEQREDNRNLHRLYAAAAGVEKMVQILAIEDEGYKLETLVKFARDEDPTVRLGIAWELRSLVGWEESQTAMFALTQDADPEVAAAAREGMVHVGGPRAVPFLLDAVTQGAELADLAAERALDISDPAVVPVLLAVLKRPQAPAATLEAVLVRLADLGEQTHAAAAKPFLKHEDEAVRAAAQQVVDALS